MRPFVSVACFKVSMGALTGFLKGLRSRKSGVHSTGLECSAIACGARGQAFHHARLPLRCYAYFARMSSHLQRIHAAASRFFGFENHESHQRLGKSMFAVVLNWGEQFARGGLLVILMVEVDLIVAVVLVSGHRDDPRGRGRLGRLGDRSILGSPLAQ